MKIWPILILLLFSTTLTWGQLSILQVPPKLIWVEEFAHRDSRGGVSRSCTVNAIDGPDWRSESANAEADISISICRGDRVVSSLPVAPAATAGPAKAVQELYNTIKSEAKFEVVDIISGIGYSRYRETREGSYNRLIWMDRASGFPYRVITNFADGSVREQHFRIISVDPSTQRRLFDTGTLYPFFGLYLDQWHARLKK